MFSDVSVQTNSQGLLQSILSSSRLIINKNTLQSVENVSSGDIWKSVKGNTYFKLLINF